MVASVLDETTTADLVAELKRRCPGVLIAVCRIEGNVDYWFSEVKGSAVLLGALSAYLNLRLEKHFEEGKDDQQRR